MSNFIIVCAENIGGVCNTPDDQPVAVCRAVAPRHCEQEI